MAQQRLIGTSASQVPTNGMLGTLAFMNAANVAFPAPVSFSLGSATAPSVVFTGDINTGIYSPGADQVGISTGGTSRFEVSTTAATSTLPVVHPLGAVGTPSITFTGDLNTGIWSPAADTIAFSEGGAEAMRIDSSGRVGIGTTSPAAKLEVSAGNTEGLRLSSSSYLAASEGPWIAFNGGPLAGWDLARVQGIRQGVNAEGALVFYTNNGGGGAGTISEKARIDESGRFLVGTSTARSNVARFGTDFTPPTQFQTATESWNTGLSVINYSSSGFAPVLSFGLSASNTAGTNAVVSSGYRLGVITFNGNDGTNFEEGARIEALVDGTPGANDMPGRLAFFTTADGANTPTERLRIDSSGRLLVGTTTTTGFPSGARHIFIDGATTYGSVSIGNIGGSAIFTDINLTGWSGGGANYFTSKIRQDGSTGALTFYTQSTVSSNGTGTTTERMRIDSSGRVGIGTTSPGTSRAYIQADDTNTAGLTINGINSSGGVSGYSSLKITGSTPNAVLTHYGVEFVKTASNVEGITGYYADITGSYRTQTNFHAKLTKNVGAFTNGYCYYADLATSGSGGAAYFAYFYNSTSSAERFSITSDGTTTLTSAASTAPFIAKIGSSEVSRIDSSGRLLVGTSTSRVWTSTQGAFQIESVNEAAASITCNRNDSFGPFIGLIKTRGTSSGSFNLVNNGDQLGIIYYNGTDGTQSVVAASIGAFVDGTPGTNDMPGRLVFSTTADAASTPTERMRIDSSGRVGIGTTSPSEALTVAGNIRANNTNAAIGAYGVNSSSPQFILGNSAGTAHYLIYETIDGLGNRGSFNIYDNVTAANRLTIDTSGRVGIGATSPAVALDVSGSLQTTQKIVVNNAGSSAGTTDVSLGTLAGGLWLNTPSGTIGYLALAGNSMYAYDSSGHRWNVGGSERLRIDSSGRLLIGTSTAPSAGSYNQYGKLVVQGNAYSANTTSVLSLNRGEDAASIATGEEIGVIVFGDSAGNEFGSIQCVANAAAGLGDYPGRLVFSTTADGAASPTERVRIDGSGRLLVGTPTANISGAKLQTVDGITFPATQVANADPNTLDDYEEGTWTPTIIGTTTAGTASYTYQTATYTKVGRLIHVSVHVQWSGGTGTGNLRISGLPFTPSAFGSLAVGQSASIVTPAGTWLTAQVNSSIAAIVPIYNYVAGSASSVEVGYDAAGTLILAGTYSI